MRSCPARRACVRSKNHTAAAGCAAPIAKAASVHKVHAVCDFASAGAAIESPRRRSCCRIPWSIGCDGIGSGDREETAPICSDSLPPTSEVGAASGFTFFANRAHRFGPWHYWRFEIGKGANASSNGTNKTAASEMQIPCARSAGSAIQRYRRHSENRRAGHSENAANRPRLPVQASSRFPFVCLLRFGDQLFQFRISDAEVLSAAKGTVDRKLVEGAVEDAAQTLPPAREVPAGE